MYDVVYFVKDKPENEELVYSLRSVEKNFPCDRVWFFGGCPKNLKPDVYIPVEQNHGSKYQNVRELIWKAINDPNLTEDFYLFNDDFFVLSKVGFVIPTANGSLYFLVNRLKQKYRDGYKKAYRTRLESTIHHLEKMNKDCLNYELHIPMLINKTKAKRIFSAFDNTVAFRSAYGNFYGIAKALHPDVKIIDYDKTYDPDVHNVFVSSSDYTWNHGLIGKYVRSKFKEPSRFEI